MKDLIGENAGAEFARSREHIRIMADVLTRVRDIAEQLVSAANTYSADMQQLSKELRCCSRPILCSFEVAGPHISLHPQPTPRPAFYAAPVCKFIGHGIISK